MADPYNWTPATNAATKRRSLDDMRRLSEMIRAARGKKTALNIASRASTDSAQPATGQQGRKTHPVTWVASAIVAAVLCWDLWQTVRESREPPRPAQALAGDLAPGVVRPRTGM